MYVLERVGGQSSYSAIQSSIGTILNASSCLLIPFSEWMSGGSTAVDWIDAVE